MRASGLSLERAGGILAIIGAATLAAMLLIVLLNGAWPEFLRPIRELFAGIGNLVGDAALLVEGLIFIGPGMALRTIGQKLQETKPTVTK